MSTGAGTALAVGPATITAANGGLTATTGITVLDGSRITASPTTLSLSAGGTAQTFTVTCRKPDGTTDASPTYTATSSNTGIATVTQSGTTVTVTPVAAGSCAVNLSYTTSTQIATGSVSTTVTGVPGAVTSVTVSPASSLFFPSETPALTAKDQSGNVLDGTVGSWSSSDAVHAPINATTGAVTPSAVSMIGVTFTYTHTASGKTGTATATVMPSYTVVKEDKPWANYTSTADLQAATRNSVGDTSNAVWGTSTAGAGARYTDGYHANLVSIDTTTAGSLGAKTPTILFAYPAGDAAVGPSDYGILRANYGATTPTKNRVWFLELQRMPPAGEVKTGTANGTVTASDYNPYTGTVGAGPPAAGTKNGPFVTYSNYNGRTGFGYLGQPTRAACQVWDTMDTAVAGQLTTSPATEVQMGTVASTELTGDWYFYIGLAEHKSGNIMSSRLWRAKLGGSVAQVGSRFEGYMAEGDPLPLFNYFSLSENFNQSRAAGQSMFKNVGYWCVIDGDAYGDPFGILGTQPAQTLTSIDVSSVAHGTTSQNIVFTGTNFNENCHPVFSNAGVRVLSLTYTSATSITANIAVTSTATTGAGTVLMHNNASGTDSGTVAFTVT